MSGELSRQIQELRGLVGSPRDPEGRAFAQLGDALRRTGEIQEALSVLRAGVSRHPDFVPGHLALAWAAQASGDGDEALRGFRRVLELDGENPFGLFGVGSILAAGGDEKGVVLVEQALELHPGVRDEAPEAPRGLRRAASPSSGGDLPFVPLRDLAPEAAPEAPAVMDEDLPFVALAELSPDLGGVDSELPFLPLSDMAPGPAAEELQGLPFVSLGELAPGLDGLDSAEAPFVALGDLAPWEWEEVRVPGEDDEHLEAPAPEAAALSPREIPAAPEAEDEPGDASPVTRTMAELFARQGLVDRAARIYEQLVAANPADDGLVARLLELRQEAGDAAGDAHEASHPALTVPEPAPVLPSPYGWSGEGEDPATPPPDEMSAGAYFGRLLAWTTGNPAREADEATSPDTGREGGGIAP